VVQWGGLEVVRLFPVHRWGGKTALFLRRSLSIFLVEVPARSTSPHVILMAKSFWWGLAA
jgi:hypothetical protein